MTSRREFLGMAAAVCASDGKSLFTGSPKDYDENLTVFLSDMHIGSSSAAPKYQPMKFGGLVAEILRLNPLPKRVVVFGDISWKAGILGDYEAAYSLFRPLSDAGIEITYGMGNHERRRMFLEKWPEYAKTSPVPGRIVSVVPLKHADLVMLDTLKGEVGGTEEIAGPGSADLGDAQQEWLEDWVSKAKRPFFLASHHPEYEPSNCQLLVKGKRIDKFMWKYPLAAGYIHGHNHKWRTDLSVVHYSPNGQFPILGLPSAGYWGDIGYVLFRTSPKGARATLRQTEYFFARWTGDVTNPATHPAMWKERARQNDGQTCLFTFPRDRPWSEERRKYYMQ